MKIFTKYGMFCCGGFRSTTDLESLLPLLVDGVGEYGGSVTSGGCKINTV